MQKFWNLCDQTAFIIIATVLVMTPSLVDLNILVGAGPDSKYRLMLFGIFLAGFFSIPKMLREAYRLSLNVLSLSLWCWVIYLLFRGYFDPRPSYAIEGALWYSSWAMLALLISYHCQSIVQFKQLVCVVIVGQLFPVIVAVGNTFGVDIFLQWIMQTDWAWHSEQIDFKRGVVWSTLGNPNYYANYGSLLLVWLIAGLFFIKPLWLRILLGVYIVSLLYTLVYTHTRGVWVGILPTAGFAIFIAMLVYVKRYGSLKEFVFQYKKLILAVVVGFTCLTGFSYLYEIYTGGGPIHSVIKRFEHAVQLRDASTRARPLMWNASIRMWSEAPVFGKGIKRYSSNFLQEVNEIAQETGPFLVQRVTRQMNTIRSDRSHNDYLNFLAETGTIGFAIILLIFLMGIAFSIKQLFQCNNESDSQVMLMASLCGLVMIMIFCLYDFPLQLPASAGMFSLAMGGIMVLSVQESDRLIVFPRWTTWVFSLVLLISFVLGTGFIAKKLVASHVQFDGQDIIRNLSNIETTRYAQLLEAETLIKLALDHSPEDGQIQYDLGRVYTHLSQHQRVYLDRAARQFEASKETFAVPQTYAYLANIYLRVPSPQKARHEVELLRIVDPGRNEIEFMAGMVDFIAGRFSEAETHFQEELRVNPTNHQAMFYLGRIADEYHDDPNKAEYWYQKQLEMIPGSRETYQRLGILYKDKLNDLVQARVNFMRALEIAQELNLRQEVARINVWLDEIKEKLGQELLNQPEMLNQNE